MKTCAMSNYWKEHYDANAEKFADSPLKQVDRTINGREMDLAQLALTIEAVVRVLDLQPGDSVIDLCCGNGLITKAIAQHVRQVVAVDFSDKLVAHAKQLHQLPNIEYIISDVLNLPVGFFATHNKIYMRDSISCLDSAGLTRLLRTIGGTSGFEMFYIAGVPDKDKLSVYYDTEEKMAFYRQREATGMPHIGTWWTMDEMHSLVEDAGLKVSFFPQDNVLASAYYRYDCLVEPRRPASRSA